MHSFLSSFVVRAHASTTNRYCATWAVWNSETDPLSFAHERVYIQTLLVLCVVSYFTDRLMRLEFETRMRLSIFRRQLDSVAEHVGSGAVATAAAAATATRARGSGSGSSSSHGEGQHGAGELSYNSRGGDDGGQTAAAAAAAASASAPAAAAGEHDGVVDLLSLIDSDDDDDLAGTVRKSVQHAQEINRMLQVSEARQSLFLAAMSHELRTPLTAVLGCTDLLSAVRGLNDEARECVVVLHG